MEMPSRPADHVSALGQPRIIATGAATVAATLLVVVTAADMPTRLQGCIGICTLMILFRIQLGLYIAPLLMFGYQLIPQQGRMLAAPATTPGDIVFLCAFALYVSCGLRYLEATSRRNDRRGDDESDFEVRGPQRHALRPLSHGWLGWPIAVSLALSLLLLLPLRPGTIREYGLIPEAVRSIAVLWFLTLITVVVLTVVGYLRWRTMTPAQAAIALRRTLGEGVGGALMGFRKPRAKKRS